MACSDMKFMQARHSFGGQACDNFPWGERAVRYLAGRPTQASGHTLEDSPLGKDMVPKRLFFTKGVGKHKERLTSFELALRDAGIAAQRSRDGILRRHEPF